MFMGSMFPTSRVIESQPTPYALSGWLLYTRSRLMPSAVSLLVHSGGLQFHDCTLGLSNLPGPALWSRTSTSSCSREDRVTPRKAPGALRGSSQTGRKLRAYFYFPVSFFSPQQPANFVFLKHLPYCLT